MSGMYNPPHPGEILADTVLGDGGINVTEFAKRLGMTRTAVSRVVNGHAAVSTDLAMRLEDALGTSAETWLAMQAAYDLWQAKKNKHRKKIARIEMEEEESVAA
jgi:addiction module HigA family antidote